MFFECRHVTKQFGSLTAVGDVSFSIEEGQVLGIMGPNGAGKSTLLNAILEEEKAIVSDIEGTTRDAIEDTINLVN